MSVGEVVAGRAAAPLIGQRSAASGNFPKRTIENLGSFSDFPYSFGLK